MNRFELEEAIKNKSFIISPRLKDLDLEEYKKTCENYDVLNECEELTIYNMNDNKNLLSKDFKNLKLLKMIGCELIKFKNLEKLNNLKYLIINYLYHNTIDNNNKNIKYDTELPILDNLEYLEIEKLFFNVKIPYYKNLKYLIIKNIYYSLTLNYNLNLLYLKIENSILLNIPDTFINLKILELDYIDNLKELPDTLINLERLTIKDCKNLYYLPETLINLKNLTINVSMVSKLKIKYIPKTYTNLEYFSFSYNNYNNDDLLINICIQINKNSNFNNFKNNFLFLPYEVFKNLKVFNYYNCSNNFNLDLNKFKKLVNNNLYVNNNFLII